MFPEYTAAGVRDPATGRVLAEVVLGRKVTVKLRADGTVAEPVAAFDVTFSPSKSVSVLWATATDQTVRDIVVDVHERAVSDALAHLTAATSPPPSSRTRTCSRWRSPPHLSFETRRRGGRAAARSARWSSYVLVSPRDTTGPDRQRRARCASVARRAR